MGTGQKVRMARVALAALVLAAVPVLAAAPGQALASPDSGVVKREMVRQLEFLAGVLRTGYAPAEWKKKHFGWELDAQLAKAVARVQESGRPMWTTSFVLVETMALLQHRIGLDAARDFDEELLPAIRVSWVDDDLYRAATERLWREDRRDVSLVDCVSFEFMKREGLTIALAIDPDFREAGFDVLPSR